MAFFSYELVLKLYLVGFAGSFIVQSVFQRKFGRESSWGINQGWQTEIAIWNIFAVLTLSELIYRHVESDFVMLALFLMSLGFGSNHLFAAMKSTGNKSNFYGAAANGMGLGTLICWFFCSRL